MAVMGAIPGRWRVLSPLHLLLLPERAILAKGEKFFEKMSRVGTKNCAVQKHSAGEKWIETVTAPGGNGGRPGPSSPPYRRPSRRGGATGTQRRELRQYYALFRKRLLATVESTSQVSRTFDLLGRVSLTRNSHKIKARAAGEKKKLRLVRELRPGAAWWSR